MCGFFQFYIVLITFIFYFIPKYVPDFDIKSAALVVTLCVLIEFLIEFKFYDQTFPFQLNISEFFVGENLAEFSIFHFSYDAISLILCILTVFIFPIVILVS
jgi:NADH:ubiquinone oxidoreductase subunit 4 (subunit M)